MANMARRNFRRDTQKLADILRLLPSEKIAHLMDFTDYYVNREREFSLAEFITGIKHDIVDWSSAEDLLEFRRILGIYESRGTMLRLLALLNDALRLAAREKERPPTAASAMVPNLNDPVTKRILNGM